MHLLINVLEKVAAILYPSRCLNCRKIITEKYFCDDCKDVVARITVKTCPKCGLPQKFCACKWNFYYFDEIISCLESDDIPLSLAVFLLVEDSSHQKWVKN